MNSGYEAHHNLIVPRGAQLNVFPYEGIDLDFRSHGLHLCFERRHLLQRLLPLPHGGVEGP